MKKLLALILALLPLPALADQNTLYNTTTGTLPGLTMVTVYNAAHNTLATNFSGNSAPSSPLGYQFWANTSTTPRSLNIYDGASWLTIGQIDASGHNWNPQGNAASFASATLSGSVSVGNNLTVTNNSTFTKGVGVGGGASGAVGVYLQGSPLSTGSQYGVLSNIVYSSAATTVGYGVFSAPSTAAASFTMPNYYHFNAADISIGSGSAVTNQYGYYCGVNNAATNDYCFYAANSNARNYFAGKLLVGASIGSPIENQGYFQVYSSIGGGNPQTSGSTDANTVARIGGGSVSLDTGIYASGKFWVQARAIGDNSNNYGLVLNPNGGDVSLPSVYGATTASAANVTIDSTGKLFRSTSSRRYKHDIADYTRGISEVMELRPVFYKGNNDGNTVFAGLIAEEVDSAGLTEFVQYDKQGRPDALAYANMVALSFKALQDLKHENDALRAEISAIKSHVGME